VVCMGVHTMDALCLLAFCLLVCLSACWDLFYTLFLYFLTFCLKGSKWSERKPLFAAGLDLKICNNIIIIIIIRN
jgi:hypothetical protein